MSRLRLVIALAGCHHAVTASLEERGPPRPDAGAAPSMVDCCYQCSQASRRDPSGVDIELAPCTKYRGAVFNGGPGVDEACATELARRKILVRDCEKR
jgi:hypothetical protein